VELLDPPLTPKPLGPLDPEPFGPLVVLGSPDLGKPGLHLILDPLGDKVSLDILDILLLQVVDQGASDSPGGPSTDSGGHGAGEQLPGEMELG